MGCRINPSGEDSRRGTTTGTSCAVHGGAWTLALQGVAQPQATIHLRGKRMLMRRSISMREVPFIAFGR